ncbi:hypothetical protein PABG_03194 [Paracoccidioides brasiliensis Pb03]|nr:hypothetical protein PABG_03194 [Paracoccidioides brasiliensis Pb03]
MAGKAEDRLIGSVEQATSFTSGSNFRSVGILFINNDNTSGGVLMDVPQSEGLGKCNTKFLMKEALSSIRRHRRVLAHALFVQASRTYGKEATKDNAFFLRATPRASTIGQFSPAATDRTILVAIKLLFNSTPSRLVMLSQQETSNGGTKPATPRILGRLNFLVCVGLDLPSLGRPVVGSGLVRGWEACLEARGSEETSQDSAKIGTRGWLLVGNGGGASEVEVA